MMVFLKNRLRKFDKARRQKMNLLESLLYRLIKNDSRLVSELMPNTQVKRILVIRNNKRIGNILFIIPFIRQVLLAYPNAKIDLMLTMSWQGQFFDGMGINNIYYSNFSFFGIFKWLNVIKTLNQLQYDLVLAPTCSTNDALAAATIASKNKVSSYNKRRALAFPHSSKSFSRRAHAAYGSLSVLEDLGYKLVYPLNHHLEFSRSETEQGYDLSCKYMGADNALNLVFFRGARGDKFLTATIWESILSRFEEGMDRKINWIEVLSPDITTPLRENIKTFETKNMRLLGCFLSNFDGFICCDTGPLHLADASGVKCIGLYTHTNIDDYGILGEKSIHVTDINNFDVSEICNKLGLHENYQDAIMRIA